MSAETGQDGTLASADATHRWPAQPNEKVVIVGGGLAGMAAAIALCDAGLDVHLLESRNKLGGRASSFRDPQTDSLVDYCQHVSMSCCTCFVQFCRRLHIENEFRVLDELHFFSPDGRQIDMKGAPLLPAPLHLFPFLLRLRYLSWRDRIRIARAMLRLARIRKSDVGNSRTMLAWLEQAGQSPQSIALFWEVVLVSALGERLDKIAVSAARKVFVDGFMSNRTAYRVWIPELPLGELYGQRLHRELSAAGVTVECGTRATAVEVSSDRAVAVTLADNTQLAADHVVLAVTWRHASGLLTGYPKQETFASLEKAAAWSTSPISGIHLWFDRRLTDLSHAVLVGKLSHWLFYRGESRLPEQENRGHYYQVVISASHELASMDREEAIKKIVGELQAIFPAAGEAHLLQAKIVTERHAVFSPLPEVESTRPAQQTAIENLLLAGDWTETGWPATMESAVRSGYLAAEAILNKSGRNANLLPGDLKRGWLARVLF